MILQKNIIFKYFLIYLVVVAAMVVAVVQMVRLQLTYGDSARIELNRRALQKTQVIAPRGDILAHDGSLLVTSMLKHELHYDFTAVRDNKAFDSAIDSISRGLAAILKEKTAAEYAALWRSKRQEALASKGRRNKYILITAQHIDYPTLLRIRRLPLLRLPRGSSGLITEPKMERIYPYNQLARQTLGWVNRVGEGAGVEFSYQKEIGGKAGWEWRQRVSRTAFAPVSSQPEVMPVSGSDVVTTIDADLQQIAEEAVISQLRAHSDLEWGCAALMDVKTGAIRAIANKRREAASGNIIEDDNYALRYRKDPGSTFKLISFMVMLEKGLDLNQSVSTGSGAVSIYGKTYEDEGSHGGAMTAMQVFANSSNAGTVRLMQQTYPSRRSWDDFMERIDAMKIKELTNFDIKPQQDISPVIRIRPNDALALYAMSIGVALEMTPLQTLAVYNAIANEGVMVHPYFVQRIIRQGRTLYQQKGRRVVNKSICSRKTLDKLQYMLRSVVDSGTARRARSEMFAIAGKTGTAHIAEGSGGYSNKKLASFVGYFPADQPMYSAIVAFRTCETTAKTYGGQYAAPVFKTIAERTYCSAACWRLASPPAGRRSGGEASSSALPYRPPSPQGKGKMPTAEVDAPYTKSGSADDLKMVLGHLKIPLHSVSTSQWVSTSASGGAVLTQPRYAVQGLMPNVVGMGIRDAVYLLETNGLRARFTGIGTVVEQRPQPGAQCDKGEIATLQLSVNND